LLISLNNPDDNQITKRNLTMAKVLANPKFEGIYIESDTSDAGKSLGTIEGGAFLSATRRALDKIASKPIGFDLLTQISKKAKGIGIKNAGNGVTIQYGPGTLSPGRIDVQGSLGITAENPLTGAGDRTNTPVQVKVASGAVVDLPVNKAGAGTSSVITYNPFIDVGQAYVNVGARITLKASTGCEYPAFIALAHELCHAWHDISGNAKAYPQPEEAYTVGAGKFANTRISENAIRKEHGILPLRSFYVNPGDCD